MRSACPLCTRVGKGHSFAGEYRLPRGCHHARTLAHPHAIQAVFRREIATDIQRQLINSSAFDRIKRTARRQRARCGSWRELGPTQVAMQQNAAVLRARRTCRGYVLRFLAYAELGQDSAGCRYRLAATDGQPALQQRPAERIGKRGEAGCRSRRAMCDLIWAATPDQIAVEIAPPLFGAVSPTPRGAQSSRGENAADSQPKGLNMAIFVEAGGASRAPSGIAASRQHFPPVLELSAARCDGELRKPTSSTTVNEAGDSLRERNAISLS